MKYTDEQLQRFNENLEQQEILKSVFEAIEESSGANMKEIGAKTRLSAYPRDKAIFALEFAGFIEKKDAGVNKIYSLTAEGNKLSLLRRG